MKSSDPVCGPAPRPCDSCPYRRDVPSGVWHPEEYAKLPGYDGDTSQQRTGVFHCHTDRARMCAGWVGCHGGSELLALRFALVSGRISGETFEAASEYESPVPLFASGAEAERHGVAEADAPSASAVKAMRKIANRRA